MVDTSSSRSKLPGYMLLSAKITLDLLNEDANPQKLPSPPPPPT
uniref:Uncharacterized protein n=1 Tax=Arundo donax TaxID=35708 RepID=A0A0A8Z8U0_ARUDO